MNVFCGAQPRPAVFLAPLVLVDVGVLQVAERETSFAQIERVSQRLQAELGSPHNQHRLCCAGDRRNLSKSGTDRYRTGQGFYVDVLKHTRLNPESFKLTFNPIPLLWLVALQFS